MVHGGLSELFLVCQCSTTGVTNAVVCTILVHIKYPLLLIRKNPCSSGTGFPLSLNEWSFTIFPTSYKRK